MDSKRSYGNEEGEKVNIVPEHFLVIYISIETLKFLAAKLISHNEQMLVIKEIVRYQKDTASILERILESHNITPKEKEDEDGIPKVF